MRSRICSNCKKKKPLNKFHRDKTNKGGHKYKCKECSKAYFLTEKGKQTKKANHLKNRYNLTLKQHKQMYLSQNGCCAVCKVSVPYDKMDTDHSHKTNKVRGLLCRSCNIYTGVIERAPDLVPKILEYIRRLT